MSSYLKSVSKLFSYYKSLGEKTFAQLGDEQLFWQANAQSNSIAIIVNHLSGNMLSRWTDFRTSDGEKEWRNRDQEFEDIISSREEMLYKWNQGWKCLFGALEELNSKDLDEEVYIRNMGHTITEAINRQLAHYSYHVGQIVFLGKLIQDQDWETLSIAKGKSKEYNTEKFAEPRRTEHFTDNYDPKP